MAPLHRSSQVVGLPRQLLATNLTTDDLAGPLALSLLAHVAQVSSRKAVRLRCDASQRICRQVVCVLLQDGCTAGLVRQAEMDGQVKPASRQKNVPVVIVRAEQVSQLQ
jgi:hypothetical protein